MMELKGEMLSMVGSTVERQRKREREREESQKNIPVHMPSTHTHCVGEGSQQYSAA